MSAVQQQRPWVLSVRVVVLLNGDGGDDGDVEVVAEDWDLTERPIDGWENGATSSYLAMFDIEDDRCGEQSKLIRIDSRGTDWTNKALPDAAWGSLLVVWAIGRNNDDRFTWLSDEEKQKSVKERNDRKVESCLSRAQKTLHFC